MIGVDDNWGTTPEVLITALQEVRERYPNARLLLNQIDNLGIVQPEPDGVSGDWVGFIYLGNERVAGEGVSWWEDEDGS